MSDKPTRHVHNWEDSINHDCPKCRGIMQLCTNAYCSLHRCRKEKTLYELRDGYLRRKS